MDTAVDAHVLGTGAVRGWLGPSQLGTTGRPRRCPGASRLPVLRAPPPQRGRALEKDVFHAAGALSRRKVESDGQLVASFTTVDKRDAHGVIPFQLPWAEGR